MFEKICYFESTCKTIKMQNSPTESKPEKVNDNIKSHKDLNLIYFGCRLFS